MSSRRAHLLVVAAAAAVPRLVVLFYERGRVLSQYTEKSDDFARTFVDSGTYGFIPGEPSAWTQPLYGFFLIPLYELFGRSWPVVGLAQIGVAVATALLVWAIGRRAVSATAGLVAGVVASLHPYLVWHDVHVNREILDTLLAAALVLLTLKLAERPAPLLALGTGAVAGLAILGNSRLAALPLLLAAYVAWRVGWTRTAAVAGAALVAAAAVTIAPWAVRNEVQVGCFAITTDSKALWKANNPATYDVLEAGGWIDDVPNPPGSPPTPEMAFGIYQARGDVVDVDECAQMRFYQDEVFDFWRDEPGEKARLAVQATEMLWSPRGTQARGRPGAGTWLDTARDWALPVYVLLLAAGALAGIRLLPRSFVALALALLAYQTLAAMVFAGATRYRVPWDFLLALLAAGAVAVLWERRSRPREDAS
ncbi:MAG: glycosyltransferase family 39 protein [Gaiellaceae bacterium]